MHSYTPTATTDRHQFGTIQQLHEWNFSQCIICQHVMITFSHTANYRKTWASCPTLPYSAVYGSWTDHVHGLCTAVYTGRKTAVYMVHGHVRIVYTAVFGSWTDHVHGPCMVVYGLYTALVMYPVHGRPVYTTTQCIPGIAKVDSRNLL